MPKHMTTRYASVQEAAKLCGPAWIVSKELPTRDEEPKDNCDKLSETSENGLSGAPTQAYTF